jgi:hypothetical protein
MQMSNANLPRGAPTPAKKSTWPVRLVVGVIVAIFIGHSRHSVSSRDLAKEASGQQAVSPTASSEEKQAVGLIAQIIALHKEGDNRDTAFEKTFVGTHLLEPATFSSTAVASQSLEDISAYCASTMDRINRTQIVFSQLKELDTDDHTDFSWVDNQFKASREWCSAAENLYQYASDPTRNIHVSGGIVRLVGVDGYNERIAAVNAASKKFAAADAAFKEAQRKLHQKDGTTPSDYGFKP